MPKQITRLRIDEGSLVDEPANIGARVLLWKRHDPAADPVTDEDPAMATKNDDLSERVGELEDQIGDLTKANADLTEALKKAQQPSLPLQPPPGAAEAQLKKERDELQAKLKAAEDELAKAKAPPPEPETESLLKNLNFEQRERSRRMQKSVKELQEQQVKMRDEAELRDAITKVEKTWVLLPVKAKDFGPVYRKIVKALADEPDGMVIVDKVLTGATARSLRSRAPPSAVEARSSRPAMSGPRRKPRRCSCAPRSPISPPIRRSPRCSRSSQTCTAGTWQELGTAQ